MAISKGDLERWRDNSIKIALELGFDIPILNFIKQNARLVLARSLPPGGMFFGWCIYDDKKPQIKVYHRNLSTEIFEAVRTALKAKGMNDKLIEDIEKVHDKVTPPVFFEIYNQSGMDHELIGHLYNQLKGLAHDEPAAVHTQLTFAKTRSGLFTRSGRNWKRVLRIMPIVLGYHKGIDELKK
jgi:hypothetical protein